MAFKMKGYNSPLNKENMLHSKSASLKNGKTTLVYNAK